MHLTRLEVPNEPDGPYFHENEQHDLVIVEVAICFAMPVLGLAVGLLTIPLWIAVLKYGEPPPPQRYLTTAAAWWSLFSITGGFMGIVGLFSALRFYVSSDLRSEFYKAPTVVLVLCGLLALWAAATDGFTYFSMDLLVFFTAVLLTLCAIHVLILAFQREKWQRRMAGLVHK